MIRSPKLLFRGRRFNIEEVCQELGDGQTVVRHVVRHPGAVVILPLVDDSHVCMIRTYRAAVDRWLWELPAGTREPGEPAATTAARELTEETGYIAGSMEWVHTFRMSPGILDEQMHFFVARNLTAAAADREPGEEIEQEVVAWAELDRWLRDGRIEDAKTLVALLWFLRYRTHA